MQDDREAVEHHPDGIVFVYIELAPTLLGRHGAQLRSIGYSDDEFRDQLSGYNLGYCSAKDVLRTALGRLTEIMETPYDTSTLLRKSVSAGHEPPRRREETMIFPVSGVETPLWLPPLVGLVISYFTSMGGVSGAFLILPFQVSVLGFTAPAVTPTNLVFNVVGIPSAVYRYFREGRMNWPLAWNIILGTFPGLFLGMFVRVWYLPDPRTFKFFVGCVLFYLGARMLYSMIVRGGDQGAEKAAETRMRQQVTMKAGNPKPDRPAIKMLHWSLSRTEYEFFGERFSFHTTYLFVLSLVVGLVGGVYGIGGGAIIAPFIVAFFRLPVHTIAGATLMGTCVTSVGGVVFYEFFGPYVALPGQAVRPDWLLGFLFGIGGFVGMYLGASTQKYVPSAVIRPVLALVIAGVGLKYVAGYFL